MIKFRVRYRPFKTDYPPKLYYAVNIHSVKMRNGKEIGGGYLGLLRMTKEEFTVFRGMLEMLINDEGDPIVENPGVEFVEQE